MNYYLVPFALQNGVSSDNVNRVVDFFIFHVSASLFSRVTLKVS